MIIPVKCFTCGEVLANKYRFYLTEVARMKINNGIDPEKVTYFNDIAGNTGNTQIDPVIEKQPEAIIMDQLKLYNVCCRRHFFTHVDID